MRSALAGSYKRLNVGKSEKFSGYFEHVYTCVLGRGHAGARASPQRAGRSVRVQRSGRTSTKCRTYPLKIAPVADRVLAVNDLVTDISVE